MSEMVERVARAIYAKTWSLQSRLNMPAYEIQDINIQIHLEQVARAAIEAMREPTDRMANAGAARWDDDLCTETNALNMWQAMIDEALK